MWRDEQDKIMMGLVVMMERHGSELVEDLLGADVDYKLEVVNNEHKMVELFIEDEFYEDTYEGGEEGAYFQALKFYSDIIRVYGITDNKEDLISNVEDLMGFGNLGWHRLSEYAPREADNVDVLNVYVNEVFVGRIENNTDTIAQLVAQTEPQNSLKITDIGDNIVITTIGNFLDNVPNQEWLKKELLTKLQHVQFGLVEMEEIEFIEEEQ